MQVYNIKLHQFIGENHISVETECYALPLSIVLVLYFYNKEISMYVAFSMWLNYRKYGNIIKQIPLKFQNARHSLRPNDLKFLPNRGILITNTIFTSLTHLEKS